MVITSFSRVVATVTSSGCVGLLFPRILIFEDWGIVYIRPSFLGKKVWNKFLWSCDGLDFSWDGWHLMLQGICGAIGTSWKERWNKSGCLDLKQGKEKPHSSAKQRPAKRVPCSTLFNVPAVTLFWRDRSLQPLPPALFTKPHSLGELKGCQKDGTYSHERRRKKKNCKDWVTWP